MYFHSHALEQFITRYDRSLSHAEAHALLARCTIYKAEKTRTGEQYWDVPELGVRLIVKRWNGSPWHGQQVCITIVKDTRRQARSTLELELLRGSAARGAPRDRDSDPQAA